MTTNKKSPVKPAPGQVPKEGTEMEQNNPTRSFTPAQTPKASEIQTVALWVAERIGTGLNPEELPVLRDNLLSLAGDVESVEQLLFRKILLGSRADEVVSGSAAPAGGAA